MNRVITISATYGAGGTFIGPKVAEQLGMPFLNRLISPDVARQVHASSTPSSTPGEGLGGEEERESLWRRAIDALARMPSLFGTTMPQPAEGARHDDDVRNEAERALCRLAEQGGVAMGFAGMIVLRGRPGAVHVRLDGPVEARVRQGAELEHLPIDEARRRQQETDSVRLAYARRLYDCDPRDPSLYHLAIDSTALPLDCCVQLIVEAANARWAAAPA